ncbi:hypothetical protein [Roseivirga sp.]|uniref:hypothetical protein n=1 Tax=Roseivirga sp. TaxID=1964215 RepID=UPI003B8B70F8
MKAIVVILIIILSSCSDLYIVPESHYIIPEGKHSSKLVNGSIGDKLRSIKTGRLEFSARFDNSARYDLHNNNQQDINKLMGFSEANQHHQDGSIRFGWRYDKAQDMVEIFAYAYRDKQLYYEGITMVEIGQTAVYRIVVNPSSYYLEVDGVSLVLDREQKEQKGFYYMLYPYFGGDEKAPHDIHIYIKELFR